MAAVEIDDEAVINGCKFSVLLVNFGTEALRKLLDSRIHIHPLSTLATILAKHKTVLSKLNNRRILTKSQWDKLFPATCAADSKSFDISLLVALLRNVIKLRAPATGWDNKPCPTDTSLEAAVVTIKWYRNNIYGHATSAGIDNTSFQTYWKDVSSALVQLGTDAAEINKLKGASVRRESWIKKLYKCDFTSDISFLAGKYHTGTRLWVFGRVEKWFKNRESNERVLVLQAKAGMGKSVIAGQLCTVMQRDGTLVASHFCQYNNRLRQNPRILIQSVARMLCENLPGFEEILTGHARAVEDLTDLNLTELFTLVLQEPVNMLADPDHNVMILIDALDECESTELLDVIATHFHKLPTWMKFLVTTRPQKTIVRKLDCLKPFVMDAGTKENLSDIKKLLEEQLQEFELSDEHEKVISFLADQSEGLMLYAHFIIESVKLRIWKLNAAINSFPRGIASVYYTYFRRLEQSLKVDSGTFTHFLEALAAAAGTLPVAMATQILCLDSEECVIRSVSILLPICKGSVHVFHKSVVDWLCSKENYETHTFSVNVSKGHEILAAKCEEIYQRLKERRQFVVNDLESPEVCYALQYGLQHMFNVAGSNHPGYREKLYRFACDLEILYAKLWYPTYNVYSIIEELTLVRHVTNPTGEDLSEIDDYIRCLKRHPYILTKSPRLIFQLMANEAESASVVLEASVLGREPRYRQDVWLQIVNKEQFLSPILSKYRCATTVNCCDVSPDKTLAVCGCDEGIVSLWSLESGKELWVNSDTRVDAWREEERCNYCVFLPDIAIITHGRIAHATCIMHGRLDQVYNLDGTPQPLFPDNTYTFIDSCFSPDGDRLLTRQSHIVSKLILWDLHTGNALLSFEEASQSITCFAFARCGRYVISGSFHTGLSVWDTREVHHRRDRRRFSNSSLRPSDVHCITSKTRDAQYFFLNANRNSRVLCLELRDSVLESRVQLALPTQPRSWWLGVDRECTCLFVREVPQSNNTVLPFNVRTVPVSNACAQMVAVIDHTKVIIKSADALYVYRTSAVDGFYQSSRHEMRAVAYSVEGDIIYASSDKGFLLYEASTGKFIRNDGQLERIKNFCVTQDAQHLLVKRGKTIRVCDAMTTEIFRTLELPKATQDQFLWLGEDYLLSFSKSGGMQIWNLKTGVLLEAIECHSDLIACCDVSPLTFDRVLSCDVKGEMILTNLKQKSIVKKTKTDGVSCCKFSPDGRFIATGDARGYLCVWDGVSGVRLWSTHAHDAAISSCVFLEQDCRFVITGSVDGTLKTWDRETRIEAGFMSFEEEIRSIASSSSDPQIAVALAHRIAVINVERFGEHPQPEAVNRARNCVLL